MRFMPTAVQIKSLLKSHSTGDDERFYAIAMQVAAYEARKGHQKLAEDLRQLVNEARLNAETKAVTNKVQSFSAPQGEAGDLLEPVDSPVKIADLVMDEPLCDRIQRILNEQNNLGAIKEHGLSARQRLLFTGEPGCGKTVTAAALANELTLPLFVVRLDLLISRYLGESLSKLRLILEAAEKHRAVYLFKGFDSIGFTREDPSEIDEMRRALNAFLVFMERIQSNSIIVASTNKRELLDSTLLRRFDDVVEFGLPKPLQIRETIKRLLKDVDTGRFTWKNIEAAAKNLSYAEITRAIEESIKEMLIHNFNKVTNQALVASLTERSSQLNQ